MNWILGYVPTPTRRCALRRGRKHVTTYGYQNPRTGGGCKASIGTSQRRDETKGNETRRLLEAFAYIPLPVI